MRNLRQFMVTMGEDAISTPDPVPDVFTMTMDGLGDDDQTVEFWVNVHTSEIPVTIDWGDGETTLCATNEYETFSHEYTGEDQEYTITFSPASGLADLWYFDVEPIRYVISATNPPPANILSMDIECPNYTWDVGEFPFPRYMNYGNFTEVVEKPGGIIGTISEDVWPDVPAYFLFFAQNDLYWEISSTNKIPQLGGGIKIYDCPNVIGEVSEATSINPGEWTGWFSFHNSAVEFDPDLFSLTKKLTGIQLTLSQTLTGEIAEDILENVWTQKATWLNSPNLTLLLSFDGTTPGVYQSTCPPTTGLEFAYDLVNGVCTSAGREWNVETEGMP